MRKQLSTTWRLQLRKIGHVQFLHFLPCPTHEKLHMTSPQFPQQVETLADAITVVGIELRTSNTVAAQSIPPHWQRFTEEAVLAHIPAKRGDDVFAVYTHFEHAGSNNTGLYSLVIGAAVAPDAPVPAGMVRVVVPASRRAIFPVLPAKIGRA